MKKIAFFIIIPAFIVLMVFNVALAEKPPVIIGGITPLSGAYGAHGNSIMKGNMLAVDEFNSKGGVLGGRKVVVKWLDNKCNPSESVSAMRKHLAEGIRLFVGGFSSGVAFAQIPVLGEAGGLHMATTGMTPGTTKRGVRYSALPDIPTCGQKHMELLIEKFKPKTVYMVYENTDYGRACHKFDKSLLEKFGVKIIGETFIPSDQMEHRTLLTKIKGHNPDLVIQCLAAAASLAELFKQSDEVGIHHKVQGDWKMMGDTIAATPAKLIEGFWGTTTWITTLDNPGTKRFLAAYGKKYGTKEGVSDYAELGYEAMLVLLTAINKAGTDTDIPAICRELEAIDIPEGPRGRITMNVEKCRIKYVPSEYIVQNKKMVPPSKYTGPGWK
jgi:branched-chain amino acid transport system substrate-binding protein